MYKGIRACFSPYIHNYLIINHLRIFKTHLQKIRHVRGVRVRYIKSVIKLLKVGKKVYLCIKTVKSDMCKVVKMRIDYRDYSMGSRLMRSVCGFRRELWDGAVMCDRQMLLLNILLSRYGKCVEFWKEFRDNASWRKYGMFRHDDLKLIFYGPMYWAFTFSECRYPYWSVIVEKMLFKMLVIWHGLDAFKLSDKEVLGIERLPSGKAVVVIKLS